MAVIVIAELIKYLIQGYPRPRRRRRNRRRRLPPSALTADPNDASFSETVSYTMPNSDNQMFPPMQI